MDNKDIYDRILMTLFEKRDSANYVNLFEYLNDDDKATVRAKARDLQTNKLIDIEPLPHVSFFGQTGLGSPFNSAMHERQRRKRETQFNAKIKYEGVQYVKQNLTKNMGEKKVEIHNSGQIGNLNTGNVSEGQSNKVSFQKTKSTLIKTWIKILVGVAILVIGTLIVWKLTGKI